MDEDTKRKRIQKYFKEFPGWTIFLIVFGVFLLFFSGASGWFFTFGFLLIVIGAIVLAVSQSGKPTDSEVDDWLELDRNNLKVRSKSKLGVDDSQIVSEGYELFMWLWPGAIGTQGIPVEDILHKKGKVPCKYPHFFYYLVRQSAWRFQIFYPTEHYLASYGCSFDFLRGKYVNERTAEIYYKDITILQTITEDRIDAERKGEKQSEFETFTLKVSSGDTVSVSIPSEYLIRQTLKDNLSEVPSTRCEKMVQSMRKMIQAKKI